MNNFLKYLWLMALIFTSCDPAFAQLANVKKAWKESGTNTYLNTSSNNVGVGSLNPGAKLDVNGAIRTTTGGIIFPDDTTQTTAATGSGNVGVGTINYLPVYVGVNTLGPSSIVQVGSNVGIGTASPSNLLHLNNGNMLLLRNDADPRLSLRASVSNTFNPEIFLGEDNSAGSSIFYNASTNLFSLNSGTGGVGALTPRLTIARDSGNVGIGTSASPAAFLDIASTANQDLFRVDDNGPGDASPFIIKADGNVGIGTSNPQINLDIDSTTAGSGMLVTDKSDPTNTLFGRYGSKHFTAGEEPFYYMLSRQTSSENRLQVGGGTSYGNAATSIEFYTAANNTTTTGSERMRVTSAGNVGIATTVPGTTLDIATPNQTAQMRLTSTNTFVQQGELANEIEFYTSDASANGTGKAGFMRMVGGNAFGSAYDMALGTGVPGTGATEKMRITNGGAVGIGTTIPAYNLQVVGSIGGTGWSVDTSGRQDGRGANAYLYTGNSTTLVGTDGSLAGLMLSNSSGIYWNSSGGAQAGTKTASISKVTNASQLLVGNGTQGDYTGTLAAGNIGIGTFTAGSARLSVIGGNVGIGTAIPSVKLHVQGGGADSLRIDKTAGDTTPILVDASGNLGIGLTTVGNILSARRDQNAETSIIVNNTTNGTAAVSSFVAGNSSAGTDFEFRYQPSNYTGASSGWANKGVIYAGSSTAGVTFVADGTGNGFTWENNGRGTANQKMVLNSSGNLGIGTALPGKKLAVFDNCIQMKRPDGTLVSCCVDNSNVFTCS